MSSSTATTSYPRASIRAATRPHGDRPRSAPRPLRPGSRRAGRGSRGPGCRTIRRCRPAPGSASRGRRARSVSGHRPVPRRGPRIRPDGSCAARCRPPTPRACRWPSRPGGRCRCGVSRCASATSSAVSPSCVTGCPWQQPAQVGDELPAQSDVERARDGSGCERCAGPQIHDPSCRPRYGGAAPPRGDDEGAPAVVRQVAAIAKPGRLDRQQAAPAR